MKHLSGVGSTDIDRGAVAVQTAVALLITECNATLKWLAYDVSVSFWLI